MLCKRLSVEISLPSLVLSDFVKNLHKDLTSLSVTLIELETYKL